MSPEEIDLVVTGWRRATSDPHLLDQAIADRLPGSDEQRAGRATWIVRVVSQLSRVLDHPARFAPMVADMVAERVPVTIDELATDRDALLGALGELLGPLGGQGEQAWSLAVELFAEIVADLCLDPFAAPSPASLLHTEFEHHQSERTT
jgi:hypothetical protein